MTTVSPQHLKKDSLPDIEIVCKLARHITGMGQVPMHQWNMDQPSSFYLGMLVFSRLAMGLMASLQEKKHDIMRLSCETQVAFLDALQREAAATEDSAFRDWLRIWKIAAIEDDYDPLADHKTIDQLREIFHQIKSKDSHEHSKTNATTETGKANTQTSEEPCFQREALH